jgi:hypothetical protein
VIRVHVTDAAIKKKADWDDDRLIREWGAGPGLWRGFPSRDDLGARLFFIDMPGHGDWMAFSQLKVGDHDESISPSSSPTG